MFNFRFSQSIDWCNTAIVRLVVNATLGGTPAFVNISPTTSVMAADIAGTTVTGGSRKLTTVVNSPGDAQLSIIDQDLELSPGDTLTVSGCDRWWYCNCNGGNNVG